jgi:hypothetical protein
MGLLDLMKVTLTRVGEWCSAGQVRLLNASLNYLEVGRWLRANGFPTHPRHSTRKELYEAIAGPIASQKVTFLEFGVFEGRSMREWSILLTNPQSQLHGFDSFKGLPEDWQPNLPKGTFDAAGKAPTFDDKRVALHGGYFNETLPTFVVPPHDKLIVNLDADLYSSTIYALNQLKDYFRPGTILIFDEFCDRLHELRAFDEFLSTSGQKYRFCAATRALETVAFERIA